MVTCMCVCAEADPSRFRSWSRPFAAKRIGTLPIIISASRWSILEVTLLAVSLPFTMFWRRRGGGVGLGLGHAVSSLVFGYIYIHLYIFFRVVFWVNSRLFPSGKRNTRTLWIFCGIAMHAAVGHAWKFTIRLLCSSSSHVEMNLNA